MILHETELQNADVTLENIINKNKISTNKITRGKYRTLNKFSILLPYKLHIKKKKLGQKRDQRHNRDNTNYNYD